ASGRRGGSRGPGRGHAGAAGHRHGRGGGMSEERRIPARWPAGETRPRVGVVGGSASDLPVMEQATAMLERLEIPYEFAVMSAHRNPERVGEYARTADDRGLACLICAAGMANHLAGAVAARTILPVIGIPLS